MASKSLSTTKRKSKPCSICRRWFTPHSRLGKRQKTCGSPDCKKKQKQRTQATWSKRNPSYWAAYRLKKLIKKAATDGRSPLFLGPLAKIGKLPMKVAQDLISKELLVILVVFVRMLHRSTQDLIVKQHAEIKRSIDRMPSKTGQGAMDLGAPSP